MNVLLLGAVVWFAVAVVLAVGVGRVLARADVDLPDMDTDDPTPYDLARADVSREEWQAHCDEALAVGNEALVLPFGGLYETWSATDEAAYRVTVERTT